MAKIYSFKNNEESKYEAKYKIPTTRYRKKIT